MDWEADDEPEVSHDNQLPSHNLADMPYDPNIGELALHDPPCDNWYAYE